MNRFYREVWQHIASYCSPLNDFVRLYLSVPILYRNVDMSSVDFWICLVTHVCSAQQCPQVLARLGLDLQAFSRGLDVMRALLRKRICVRSGCYQSYVEWLNNSSRCHYHTGKLRPTGHLTCCRGKGFQSPGCKCGYHDSGVLQYVHMPREREYSGHQNAEGVRLPPIEAPRTKTPPSERQSHGGAAESSTSLPAIRPI